MTADAAVTWLFVPGNRPERFATASACGASAVICDLEDAVAPADKASARAAVRDWLAGSGRAWVRVNAPGTEWSDEDVAAVRGLPGLQGLVVPKAESAVALADVGRRAGDRPLLALVESARGVLAATGIAACPVVSRLAFGSLDYAADVGADESEDSLLLARSTLVLASRACGKPPPVDGVTTDVIDMAPVQAAASYARRLGFGGKLCVHPRQVPAVAAGFAPSAEELRRARQVVDAVAVHGTGAVAVAGRLVDRPVLLRARQVLARALPDDASSAP